MRHALHYHPMLPFQSALDMVRLLPATGNGWHLPVPLLALAVGLVATSGFLQDRRGV